MKRLGPTLLLAALALPAPGQAPTPLPPVEGYIVTVDIEAIAPEMKSSAKAAPEAQALTGALRNVAKLSSRFTLAQDISRQEILSTDFIVPAGTVALHRAGDRFYVLADPKARTYVVMDAADLLTALEGGQGIVNTAYDARVVHTDERKTIIGLPAKKSVLTVTYASSIPFENTHMLVQQQNEIEIWHTAHLVSAGARDHLFFKFQQDRTGTVRKVVTEEIGFPLEVRFVIKPKDAKKDAAPQPGSFRMSVSEVKTDKRLPAELFDIPPKGFKRLDKNPYFAGALAK
jgi:hypothetical protein